MKKVFKKILLSAMFVLLGTSFAFSQDIVDVELVSLPSKLPLSGKNCDLTGLKVDIYYSNGNVTRQAYSVGNEDWTYTPDIKGNENVPENTTFVVSYKKFALPSFNSDWSADHAIPGVTKNTAHFYSNGVEFSSSEARENYKIIFPNSDPSVSGLTFCGWSATEITSVQTTAPTMVADKSNVIMGANDVTYYAVFAINNNITVKSYEDVEYSFDITPANYTTKKVTAKSTTGNYEKVIEFDYYNVDKSTGFMSSDKLSFTKNSGELHNTTDLENIKSIETNNNNLEYYLGTVQDPTSNSSAEKKGYFKIYNKVTSILSSAPTTEKITVTFEALTEVATTTTETYYVTTQPTINFVATDVNDIEKVETASYYATFSCPQNVIINSADVEAYTISVANKAMTLTEAGERATIILNNEKVEVLHLLANKGYLLKSSQSGKIDYNFEKTAYGTADASNMLVPCTETATFEAETGTYYYKLAYGDNTAKSKLGFWWGADEGGAFKVKAGGAILAVPPTSAASLMRGFSFEEKAENETGLAEEMIIESKPSAIYNLSGQRVNSVNKSGLYIVNGKTRWVNVK